MRIFAIDPGFSGAWAVIIDGRPEICGDMPIAGDGSRKRVSAGLLATFMRSAKPDLCVVERVSARPEQGVASSFRFGMSFGIALAVPAILEVPIELVAPPVWKRHFKLIGTEKEDSRLKALDLAPHLMSMLQRKKDDGRAEAILIGLYGAATWDHPA